jgi:hypothetical protein
MENLPNNRYIAQRAVTPFFPDAKVFLPGTKSPKPIVVNVIKLLRIERFNIFS